MEKSNKLAWTWFVKEDCLDEYVKMHGEPWEDVLKEHSNAGVRNYSIFQNGNQFFYVFECDDADKAFEYIAKSEACQRWNAITSKMIKGSFDFNEPDPVKPLNEIFYLK